MTEQRAEGTRPSGRRTRDLISHATLLVTAVALALLLAEIALRLGAVSTEPFRIRRAIGAAGDRPRVLILGDSFSVEYENDRPELDYDKTATLQLREWLEERGVHVLNLAQTASAPADYRERFERYGRRYRPDVVLFNYYVGNDLLDGRSREGQGQAGRIAELARRRIYLAHAWRDVRRGLQAKRHEARASEADLLNAVLIELGEQRPRQYVDGLLFESPSARAAWERNEHTLLKIAAALPPEARFVINIFPPAVQVSDSHFEFLRELGFELDPTFLQTRVHQDRILEFCRVHAIECFDFLSLFRAHANEELYLHRDTHWNRAGNALAFERLKAIVETQLEGAM